MRWLPSLVFPLVVLFSVGSAEKKDVKCPPSGFDAVENLDVAKFISASWYVQEQMEVGYLGRNTFYCVVATYDFAPGTKKKLIVMNYANRDKVNGTPLGTSGSGTPATFFSNLEAIVPDPDQPSKLLVGPTFIERLVWKPLLPFVFGPYWVVALETDDAGNYIRAIVSGGAPEVKTEKGCSTGYRWLSRFQTNGVGLWLFSRKPVDPEGTVAMRTKAKELGYDLSFIYPVKQEGCKYEKAIVKNATVTMT